MLIDSTLLWETVLGERIAVSNEEWALIGPLLPPSMVADVVLRATTGVISKA